MRRLVVSKKATSGIISGKAAVLAGVALALSLPTAGYAVGLIEAPAMEPSRAFSTFTPASGDPRLARMIEERIGSKARMMRFTPAGMELNTKRAVTVAVRVDEEAAQAISVHSAIRAAREPVVAVEAAAPRIAPTRYNLGMARGYESFAQTPSIAPSISKTATIPDLAQFRPTPGVEEDSRFAARIALEEERTPAAARTTRQTLDSVGDQSIDVAGSYRLTRNLDVTAGVRYSQDRDTAARLPDIDEQDSQAVYIGTQFRF